MIREMTRIFLESQKRFEVVCAASGEEALAHAKDPFDVILLDILLPVRDLAALERAEQNEGEVTRLSERYGVVGVHMFCPSTPDAAAHCRNFAPLYAIPEEAATGTSNGALTYYLYRRGLTAAGAENRFVQGEKMGKPSEILSRLTDGGDGVKVQVGGRAVLALRCELL